MHSHVIAWLDRRREVLSRTERDVHLGAIAQQQTTDVSAWIQQITVHDAGGHRRLPHGRRIKHRDGRAVIRRSVPCRRQRRIGKTYHEDGGKDEGKACRSHWHTWRPCIRIRTNLYFVRNARRTSRRKTPDLVGVTLTPLHLVTVARQLTARIRRAPSNGGGADGQERG